jgi:hypothetical protein
MSRATWFALPCPVALPCLALPCNRAGQGGRATGQPCPVRSSDTDRLYRLYISEKVQIIIVCSSFIGTVESCARCSFVANLILYKIGYFRI